MIINAKEHVFDNCPTCLGLAIWLNDNQAPPAEANRLQIVEAITYCEENGIRVSRRERKRAEAA